MRTMKRVHGSFACSAVVLAGLCMAVLAGCADAVGPGRDFLIRTPARRPSVSAPVKFSASPSDTGSITFEWEPAVGAHSYTITFWRGADESGVKHLEADFSKPFLTWEVASPQVDEVPFDPGNPNDERTLKLVTFRVPLSEVSAALAAAGVTSGERVYTLLSVFAENGSDRWRSPSLIPVTLIRAEE